MKSHNQVNYFKKISELMTAQTLFYDGYQGILFSKFVRK